MQLEPAVKMTLYWCRSCNVPLIGRSCGCGAGGEAIPLNKPYDLRPVLPADHALITRLLRDRYGEIPIPQVMVLNKIGGLDRYELIIANGERFGYISFNPATRLHEITLLPEALVSIVPHATRGIVDLPADAGNEDGKNRRIGGKKIPVITCESDGPVIVRHNDRYGTGVLAGGEVRVRELVRIHSVDLPDPDWGEVIRRNHDRLKDLERSAVRSIKHEKKAFKHVNVSFSGGKDSTVVLALARKAGVEEAYFVDTHLEFPETYQFVAEQNIQITLDGGDFWHGVDKIGPPGKDNRWCCKVVKMAPVRRWLDDIGPVLTVQGNRWYESFNRAELELLSVNPANPNQTNMSPIRAWRAFEVFLYLMWREIPYNPLYDMGVERIGCWLCPAMLESEYEILRAIHPELAARWDEYLLKWAKDHDLSEQYILCGMWRWKSLPPKMKELAKELGITLPAQPDIVHMQERDRRDRKGSSEKGACSAHTGQIGRSIRPSSSSSEGSRLRTWSTRPHPSPTESGGRRVPRSRDGRDQR